MIGRTFSDIQLESQYNMDEGRNKTLEEILSQCPRNQVIGDNLIKAWSKINSTRYKKIKCSVSGGSDSDIVLDICHMCDIDHKIEYVWFDTGLEYQATKEHLKYLEEKYGIEIKPYKAIEPIPSSCKKYGQPFLSKRVSDYMSRLQKYDFCWEDRPFEELIKRYPKCKTALQWWCNKWGENSRFNIDRNKWLKEFIIQNPPHFKISDKCCKYAKKDVGNQCLQNGKYDLDIIGIRKFEGGVRATAYKNCFDETDSGYDNYRPIFWYKDKDKKEYEDSYNVVHSKCYTEYGLKRTGCAGCPFGRNFEEELRVIEKYEPKLYQAVNHIFSDSYTYTRKYREFYKKENKNNSSLKRIL